MNDTERFDLIHRAGRRIVEVGEKAPTAGVGRYPGHTVTDLLVHTGRVHRRTTRVVRERLTQRPEAAPAPEGDVPRWFAEGLDEMVETLQGADPVMSCWGLGPRPTVAFWTRRMAIETDVHRWDAEAAVGEPTAFSPEVALDAIDELQVMAVPWSPSEGPRRPGPVVTIAPEESQDRWTLVEKANGYEFVPGGLADASVSGSASDLLLALFGRQHGALTEAGDADAHRHWRAIVASLSEAAL